MKILIGETGHRNTPQLQYHHASATAYFIRSINWSLLLSVKSFFTWIEATLRCAKYSPWWSLCHIVGSGEGLSLGKQRVEPFIVDPRPPFSINEKLLTHMTIITSGQSNLTQDCIATVDGQFKYDWTCVSSGPSKSTTQTANRSVKPFLHSSWQKVPTLYNGHRFPQNCPFSWGELDPIQFMIPWANPSPQSKRHHDQFSRFCTGDCRVSLYFTMGCPFPLLKNAPSHGIWLPIYYMVPCTAHPSPQPKRHLDRFSHFLQGSLAWQTDRQTMILGW